MTKIEDTWSTKQSREEVVAYFEELAQLARTEDLLVSLHGVDDGESYHLRLYVTGKRSMERREAPKKGKRST